MMPPGSIGIVLIGLMYLGRFTFGVATVVLMALLGTRDKFLKPTMVILMAVYTNAMSAGIVFLMLLSALSTIRFYSRAELVPAEVREGEYHSITPRTIPWFSWHDQSVHFWTNRGREIATMTSGGPFLPAALVGGAFGFDPRVRDHDGDPMVYYLPDDPYVAVTRPQWTFWFEISITTLLAGSFLWSYAGKESRKALREAYELYARAAELGVAEAKVEEKPVAERIPPRTLPDGAVCRHEGETGTFCSHCWANLYQAREEARESLRETRTHDADHAASVVHAKRVAAPKPLSPRDYPLGTKHGSAAVRITESTVEWTAGGQPLSQRIADIVRVKLSVSEALGGLPATFGCTVSFRDGNQLMVGSPDWRGRAMRPEVYIGFVHHLHAILRETGVSGVEFVAWSGGFSTKEVAIGSAALAFFGAIALVVWAPANSDWSLLDVVLDAMMGAALLSMVVVLRRARFDPRKPPRIDDSPGRYSPDHLPAWLLPPPVQLKGKGLIRSR